MVKLQISKSKRIYLGGKNVYEHRRICIYVPTRFFEILEPFFREEFHPTVTVSDGVATLTFSNRKPADN